MHKSPSEDEKKSASSVNDYDTPNGTGVRDYIHVNDLARAHLAALEWTATNQGSRAFNLGLGQGVSVMEMVAAYTKASGRDVPYEITDHRDGDIAIFYSGATRALAELGWKTEIGLDEMCASSWHWQNTNPDGYISKA